VLQWLQMHDANSIWQTCTHGSGLCALPQLLCSCQRSAQLLSVTCYSVLLVFESNMTAATCRLCRWYAFNIIKSWGACLCTMEIPAEAARLPNSVCDDKSSGNAVAVFYNDYNAATRACRIVNVPMQQSSFLWAYNQVAYLYGAKGLSSCATAAERCCWSESHHHVKLCPGVDWLYIYHNLL
jgi:hypothetical protein